MREKSNARAAAGRDGSGELAAQVAGEIGHDAKALGDRRRGIAAGEGELRLEQQAGDS